MSIIVYADSSDPSIISGLVKVIATKAAHEHIETIHTFEGLERRVHQLPRRINIVVLHAASEKQLADLITLKDFFCGIPLILILPDQEKETIAQAAKLCPKFTSAADSGFKVVGAVLGRMIELWGTRNMGSLHS